MTGPLRIEFLELNGDGNQVVTGEAHLDSDGRVVFDGDHSYVDRVPVMDPDNPGERLTPDDGERYLRALPNHLTDPYLRARLLDG